jgi:predicted glycosyltransferase involved in capsule biosynthesis
VNDVMPQAAIVTIVDLVQRDHQLLKRISSLAAALADTEFELVIGHADRGRSVDCELSLRMSAFDGVKLVSVKPAGVHQELSRLRNVAVAAAHAPILVLADVDIYPDLAMFRSLVRAVASGDALAMAPCVYLTEAGSRLINKESGANFVIRSALDFSREFVLHWAVPSSVMAFRRADFDALGGFCEAYIGHGYEDFDFMFRLASSVGLICPSTALLADVPYKAPLLSVGFRSALGRLCISNLLGNNIAFHMHHEKYRQSEYQMRRQANAMIFHQRLKGWLGSCSDQGGGYSSTVGLIDYFFQECIRLDVDPSRYFALFDARPRHLLNSATGWGSFKRKLRRFMTQCR